MKKLDILDLGIDIGSTTVKLVIYNLNEEIVLYQKYQRHYAEQQNTLKELLLEVKDMYPNQLFRISVCGSGGKHIADKLNAFYIQEVVANAAIVRNNYPQSRTAIELGGQDAKVIFFYADESNGKLIASDMRMNGSCAGGTGAFIDEVASLLNTSVEEFEELAQKGSIIHDISGRCGVFAKTDIQSLLNQGIPKEDIALSAFHTIAKQTIGGLAQGLEIKAPVIFEGGPLTFNKTLIRVFSERLDLSETDIIFPEHPETIVARGAVLAMNELFMEEKDKAEFQQIDTMVNKLSDNTIKIINNKPQEDGLLYFEDEEEQTAWLLNHKLMDVVSTDLKDGDVLSVYLGIDAGSTTTKFVLLDENEQIVNRLYSTNSGDPIQVLKDGLMDMYHFYQNQGITLNILGAGTTGYGEMMFAKAFGADYHTVETVSHATAAKNYNPDTSFILDIGGQDMKAIWLSNDIVTNITINEACSSGCGSFLANFATSLDIPVEKIAEAAFQSKNPAKLGSRCTVFMNSSIITEQKNGKAPEDIMAGLCRSIIENVFTKVVRISNLSALGKKVMVQGGTFKNDAVLRALEQYLDMEVVRAPYPGEMGAIGIALLTKKHMEKSKVRKTEFISFEELENFRYTTKENIPCKMCSNHCNRSLMVFSNGNSWVTGNRCERGEVITSNKKKTSKAKDMYKRRQELLLKNYEYTMVSSEKHLTIGIPRVLEFWDSMPFWTTFFQSLGFKVKISRPSSHKLYESGLSFVASDTVCFPAKLTHGHIRDLYKQKVDRIFMPMIMQMPTENTNKTSNYVCPVLKGYPLTVQYSDNPSERYQIPFDIPEFHWFKEHDRQRQIYDYMHDTFGLSKLEVYKAFEEGQLAMQCFKNQLLKEGKEILDEVNETDTYAVVLAGRPYHNDPLLSHDISGKLTKEGISVLTIDSLPNLDTIDLRYTRAEITNNFHARMLTSAMYASKNKNLEYIQIVSFGCGHDAILSDEIIRIMSETSSKMPLILKLDEGDAVNSLDIRIKSFLKTVASRREKNKPIYKELKDAYPAKYRKEDWQKRTVLVPNVSEAFCKLISGVIEKKGLKVEPLPMGEIDQIQLGKKYVHNDTCFPAQMVIGEAISALDSGNYPLDKVAIGMAKYQGDCRLSHYSALLRRALDEAGYEEVPIMSTDPIDSKDMHPDLKLGTTFEIQALWAFTMMDILEELRRQIRPYEINEGETDKVFNTSIENISLALTKGIKLAIQIYEQSVDEFCKIPYNRQEPRPKVFVTGEYLVTYHKGSNFHIEEYLESNGMEVILPRMTNVFRKDYIQRKGEMKNSHVRYSPSTTVFTYAGDKLFDVVLHRLEKRAKKHPLYKSPTPLPELAQENDSIMNRTYASGEGWLIPAEISEYAKEGVNAFVILQPFGCMPNHICGRGVIKRVKKDYPAIQVLPLDLDPDTSYANVENRLQMLIMNEKSRSVVTE